MNEIPLASDVGSTKYTLSRRLSDPMENKEPIIRFIEQIDRSAVSGILYAFIKKKKHNPLLPSASATSAGSDSTVLNRIESNQQVPQSFEMQKDLRRTSSRTTHIISNDNAAFNEVSLA